jgi:hypothetical protein
VRDADGMWNLRVCQGSTEIPTILLLHGLGATGEVWNGRSGDGWRPTFDPRAFAVGEPKIAGTTRW